MANHPHEGHRQRLKSQYNISGAEGMSDFTFLELLLFFSIPQGDTNVLAHRLIEQFGSLSGVLNATHDQLMTVKGVGEHTATYLTLYVAAMKRYAVANAPLKFDFYDLEAVGKFINSKYINMPSEKAMLIHFDAQGNYLNYTWIGDGDLRSVGVDNRLIATSIAQNHTRAAMIVHNHPSGCTFPSQGDIDSLIAVATLFRQLQVTLVDSAIVGKNEISFLSQDDAYTEFLVYCNTLKPYATVSAPLPIPKKGKKK